jgi:hypothetical protein
LEAEHKISKVSAPKVSFAIYREFPLAWIEAPETWLAEVKITLRSEDLVIVQA